MNKVEQLNKGKNNYWQKASKVKDDRIYGEVAIELLSRIAEKLEVYPKVIDYCPPELKYRNRE